MSDGEPNWPFADPPNVAVFTLKQIMNRSAWIHYVSHDEDDGAWQFHGVGESSTADAMVVALSEVVEIDQSVKTLSDLPLGWCAWRNSPSDEWKRGKQPEE